eukprot:CAMPEP_0181197048 /NCGR_PEP_ID=MMETSP1096-20121128/15817_1 /TAXON_ID=156174 ORGANISM="Chrysochromulina ericina, Strain CCMP281" /NCGR_SAMPLE_ID=MMETSP1096 /ASSEMBLY_ACC=CAM_ASM_000453 /LENGTH=34 /DNA_ID= /DNA_START= /DNA_END= /DNA_ORIENTATION=
MSPPTAPTKSSTAEVQLQPERILPCPPSPLTPNP